MALSIDPQTFIITVPQADLTWVSGTLYELDTDLFRLSLKEWEAEGIASGITFLKTHIHNTEVTVAGTVFARTVEIIAPYSVEFEDGQYTVILKDSNNNIFDVESGILVQNQVQVIPTNSAGLIVSTASGTITEQDKLDIRDRVWDADPRDFLAQYTMGAIQSHLAYGRIVHIDTGSANSGTLFPVGTEMFPVNNLADAKTIADFHGIPALHLMSNLVVGATESINDYTISGIHNIDLLIFLTAGCTTQNTRFEYIIVKGTLNGKVRMDDCIILETFGFKGIIVGCIFGDNIALTDPTVYSLIHDCGTGKVSPPIEIDMNTANLSIGAWKGNVKLVNKTGISADYVEIMSGDVEVDSTCVAGTIVIAGIGLITDNSGVGCTVITNNLLNSSIITDDVWDEPAAEHNIIDSFGAWMRKILYGSK